MRASGRASGRRAPVLLIEHGQTVVDREGRIHGSLDPPLTVRGRAQARRLGDRLAGLEAKPAMLIASDRRRALETAAIAGRRAGIPVFTTPALRPPDAGYWSGAEEAVAKQGLAPYFAHAGRRIPGGDRVVEWRRAHTNFLRDLLAQTRPGDPPLALVTHSNVIESLLPRASGRGGGKPGRRLSPPRSAEFRKAEFNVP